MSPETSVVEELRSISVVIPRGSSSVESSLAPSPSTGILSPSTSNTASTSSLPSKPGVTFAPLPEVGPRKRRSTAPLGMAARTSLAGRGRRRHGGTMSMGGNGPWTEEEQRQIWIQESKRRLHRQYIDEINDRDSDDEKEEEDPLAAFGRVVKTAGKSIWRRVSQKELRKQKQKEDEDGRESTRRLNGVKGVATKVAGTQGEAELVVETTTTPSAGDQDEDEEHFRTIGQTQTIRGGSVEWLVDELDQKVDCSNPQPDTHTH